MRDIKFEAFLDFGKFKMMLECVSIHGTHDPIMIGCPVELFEGALESTGWKMNDGYFENEKDSSDRIEMESVGIMDSGEDYLFFQNFSLRQYVGRKDKNGKEIFEGDIFRVEEDDLIYYLVIVWVQEWCMFCTLRVADEYFDYQTGGIKALDEPMFWTYTLEDTDDRRFFLCGNIYENPELLER